MSLYKRGSIYWYKFQKGGKSYQASTRTDDREAAEAIHRKARAETGSIINRDRGCPNPGVYFLYSRLAGLVKIGCSGNVTARIQEIQSMNPEELTLMAIIQTERHALVEQLLHELFSIKRHRNEWFRITEDDVDFAVKYWEQVKDANRVLEMREAMPVDKERLYTAEDVSFYLRISESTVRKWMASGYLPKVKLGSAVRVEGRALSEFIKNLPTKSPVTKIVPTSPVLGVIDTHTVAGTNGSI